MQYRVIRISLFNALYNIQSRIEASLLFFCLQVPQAVSFCKIYCLTFSIDNLYSTKIGSLFPGLCVQNKYYSTPIFASRANQIDPKC